MKQLHGNHHYHRSTGTGSALGAFALLLLLATFEPAAAQDEPSVEISSPRDGEVLTGVVEIRGTLDTPAFLSATLAFAYANDAREQWFEIAQPAQPATNAQLALWDTTAISDGAYKLRLRLLGTDGTVRDAAIGVQVRNYTTAPTPTASTTPTGQPVLEVETPVVLAATPTLVRLPAETPTPFSANPAELRRGDVLAGFARGGLAILAVFFLWGAVVLRRRT